VTGPALYERLAIVGCGLIGSSVARAARARGVVGSITVYDTSAAVRERVVALGLADAVCADPCEAVQDADLVIFATPPLAIGPAAAAVAAHLKPGATVTDVGSVKGAVADAFALVMPTDVFVRTRVLQPCSTGAGPFSPRARGVTRPIRPRSTA